jgi:predicted methyltransferase
MSVPYSEDAQVKLIESADQVTLYIDGGQAMQGWEQLLMWRSADLLCQCGSEFLEVGLGLGLSALRIAEHPNTQRHMVVEKYQEVIDLFYARHPRPPSTLEVVKADIFEYAFRLEPESLDGIFFDPYLSSKVSYDPRELWHEVMPRLVRSLRVGGAFVPYFATKPELRSPYYQFFDRVIVERHPYVAYSGTEYTPDNSGEAFIQCFIKMRP